ncbi:MAG: hypothetical protein WBY53_08405 [Acidobacteriaceae bacterium]
MHPLLNPGLKLRAGLTLLCLMCALLTLFDVLGNAAWNGINFAMALYLIFAAGAATGLAIGLGMSFSDKSCFAWISEICASITATLNVVFLFGFLLGRAKGVSLTSTFVWFGVVPVPLIVGYSLSIIFCAYLAYVSAGRIRALGN